MNTLPEPPAATAGQATPTEADRDTIRRLMAAVEEIGADKPTAIRITDETVPSWEDGPRIGDAPPVDQPGRAAMSSKAVDDTARMLGASVLIAVTGGSGTALLWASGHADPVVVALVFGAPTALTLALGRLMRRIKQAAPDEIHNHYNGTVHQDQRHTHTSTRGVWARTNNQQ